MAEQMEQREGVLTGVARTEVFGVPLGAAATGLLLAGAWDGVAGIVQATIPGARLPRWAVPAIGAFVTTRWGGRFVGQEAADTAGLILTADAIQGFFNIRGLVSGLFGGVRAAMPAAVPGVPVSGVGQSPEHEEIILPPELLGNLVGQEEYQGAPRGMF